MRTPLMLMAGALIMVTAAQATELPPAPRTAEEQAQARAKIDAEVEKQFRKTDTNSDGRISKAEFTAASPKNAPYFDLADQNRDGALSREELNAVVTLLFRQWVAKP